ncbi:MAG TPA: putative Ig domain-containing protein [Microthrixaceae bacterium]|nr:putative Ig domain-containing protein [Microthrixaceae bacterium]
MGIARGRVWCVVMVAMIAGACSSPVVGPPPTGPPASVEIGPITGVVGEAFLQSLGDLAGPGTWNLTGGALPAGVALSAAGVLSGTPTGTSGLWAADVQVATATGPQAFHVWGWISRRPHHEFPGTVLGAADAPVALFGRMSTSDPATSFTHVWELGTDGVVRDGTVIDVPFPGLVHPEFGQYMVPVPEHAAFRRTSPQGSPWLILDEGVVVTPVLPAPPVCTVRVHDATQGPVLPLLATLTSSGDGGCQAMVGDDTIFLVGFIGGTAVVDVFDFDGTLLRSVPLPQVIEVGQLAGDGRSILGYRLPSPGPYEVFEVGRTAGDDTATPFNHILTPGTLPTACYPVMRQGAWSDDLVAECKTPIQGGAVYEISAAMFQPVAGILTPIVVGELGVEHLVSGTSSYDPASGQVLGHACCMDGRPDHAVSVTGGSAGTTARPLVAVNPEYPDRFTLSVAF